MAMTHGRWRLAVTSPDGERREMSGRGTLISRRRPDGSWGIVLDDPLSPTD
jgi:ketosteroid isomerase-like protein